MINAHKVLSRLKRLIALDSDMSVQALPLCIDAAQELSAQLKKPEFESSPLAETAAAGMAFYRLALRGTFGEAGFKSCRIGDISIAQNPADSLAFAAKIRDEYLIKAASVLLDDHFVFKVV